MGFDKYRNFALAMGDDNDKLLNKYKQQGASLALSPSQSKTQTTLTSQVSSKGASLRSSAQQAVQRDGGSTGRNKGQQAQKPVFATPEQQLMVM